MPVSWQDYISRTFVSVLLSDENDASQTRYPVTPCVLDRRGVRVENRASFGLGDRDCQIKPSPVPIASKLKFRRKEMKKKTTIYTTCKRRRERREDGFVGAISATAHGKGGRSKRSCKRRERGK